MKILLFSIYLFIVDSSSYGQKLTLQELTKLNNMDWDKFDSFVLTKGYEYNTTEDLEFVESKSYSFKIKGKQAPYFISKTVAKNNSKKLVAYQTTSKQDYLSITSQLETEGFKFDRTAVRNHATLLIYTKAELELCLATIKVTENAGATFTAFEISVKQTEVKP